MLRSAKVEPFVKDNVAQINVEALEKLRGVGDASAPK